LDETLLNVVPTLPPSVVMALMAATAMSAAMRPFSMAVIPFASREMWQMIMNRFPDYKPMPLGIFA